MVDRAYKFGYLVRVLLYARNRNVLTKFDIQYSGLCEMLEVCGALLTLRELKTQRVFSANHDAVRLSRIKRSAAPQVPAARAALVPHYREPRLHMFSKRRLAEPRRISN